MEKTMHRSTIAEHDTCRLPWVLVGVGGCWCVRVRAVGAERFANHPEHGSRGVARGGPAGAGCPPLEVP
jgi:hypothetical protein